MFDTASIIGLEKYTKPQTQEFQFKRMEVKYLVNSIIADILKGQIAFYMPFDEKAAKNPFIRSVYFDNKELKCFNDHMNKINPRFKIRFRQYEKDGNFKGVGFFEIKKKISSTTIKDRFKTDMDLIYSIPDQQVPDSVFFHNKGLSTDKLITIYSEIIGNKRKYELEPVTSVSYYREAFENNEKSLRITFDSQLEFQSIHDSSNNIVRLPFRKPSDFMIMEIKHAGQMPSWLTSLLKYNALKKQHFSKYCDSIRELKINNCINEMNAFGGLHLVELN